MDKTIPWDMLAKEARAAAKHAYVPYSRFAVGAAILTAEGKIVRGCNVENASYGLTNCAERTAIFTAKADGMQEVVAVCIYTPTAVPTPPCGACRQVILETEKRYGQPIRILLYGRECIYEVKSIGDLLPLSFDASAMEE